MFSLNNSYRSLPKALWADTLPVPVRAPKLLLFNPSLAQELGLNNLSEAQAAVFFSGNELLAGSGPLAQAYAGHQFGHATLLGDGRAVLLGECLDASGVRKDIVLKGAGRTPFSRGGDGRAALGPMLREYLISESLHALGVPTARSLAVVATGEPVYREQPLAGAIVTRVASSHLRVGTFQFAAWQADKTLLPALLDYAINRHYPELKQAQNPALAFLEAVISAQIALVVHWLRVGFIHGVLNTDNVTISGEALDFGPCAFMDAYHPSTVFSSIDRQGRYAFGQQPRITQWNMVRLAEALLPLVHADENTAIALVTPLLEQFMPRFQQRFTQMMRAKLGLLDEDSKNDTDSTLINDWLALLERFKLDYTNAHLDLMRQTAPCTEPEMLQWFAHWQARTSENFLASLPQMRQHNPTIIPRNHLVQQALEAAQQGDLSVFNALFDALQRPYDERDENDPFSQAPSGQETIFQTFCGT
ncbi:MAG: YdiU family protein [Venatoribacter sp.]